MRRVKVQWQGEEVEGEEVDSRVLQGEGWSEYQLSDGTRLKMKTVVTKVVRLNKRNPEGEPIYAVTSQNVLVAQVEPHLMVDP